MDYAIENIEDLRREIDNLKVARNKHEKAIKDRFGTVAGVFSTIVSLFKKGGNKEDGSVSQDIFGILSSYVLPFILDKTLFKNSNLITKAIIAFFSQKVSGLINEDIVHSVFEWVKKLINKKKVRKHDDADYGIPPLSESY